MMKPLTVTQEPKYLNVLKIWTPLEFLSIPFQVCPLPLKRKEIVMTFYCVLSATEKLSGPFCFSLKPNKFHLVLSCIHAQHLLVEDLLLGSR